MDSGTQRKSSFPAERKNLEGVLAGLHRGAKRSGQDGQGFQKDATLRGVLCRGGAATPAERSGAAPRLSRVFLLESTFQKPGFICSLDDF